jgi:hypothetical protein
MTGKVKTFDADARNAENAARVSRSARGCFRRKPGPYTLSFRHHQHLVILGGQPVLPGEGAKLRSENLYGAKAQAFQKPGYFAWNVIALVAAQFLYVSAVVLDPGDVVIAEGHKVEMRAVIGGGALLPVAVRRLVEIVDGVEQGKQAVKRRENERGARPKRLRHVLQYKVILLIGFHKGERPLAEHDGGVELAFKRKVPRVVPEKVDPQIDLPGLFPRPGEQGFRKVYARYGISSSGQFYRVAPGAAADIQNFKRRIVIELPFDEIAFALRALGEYFAVVPGGVVFKQFFIPLLHGISSIVSAMS